MFRSFPGIGATSRNRVGGYIRLRKNSRLSPSQDSPGVGLGPSSREVEMIVLNEIAGFESGIYFVVLGGEGISKLAGKGLRQPRYSSRS